MRIGYCTWKDPFDRKSWSGLHFHMMDALKTHCGDIIPLGPLPSWHLLPGKVLNRVLIRFSGKRYDSIHTPFAARRFAAALKRKIDVSRLDMLIFPGGSEILSYLEGTSVPVIYFSDTTFKSMIGYYDTYSGLLPISEKWGNEVEGRAIAKADILLYPSHWAAESAIHDYGCPAGRISVIPCGGNLGSGLIPDRARIAALEREKGGVLRLLFIGSNWDRKGGDIALQTTLELNRRGIDTSLTVCGDGPASLKENEKVRFVGFLDQNKPEELLKFQKLYLDSSLLILPTRSECFGFVFAEASSCGLPVIATDTGGVPDYVEQEVSGYLMPSDAGFESYADRIEELWRDKERYRSFSAAARSKFERELNWESWGRRVREVLTEKIPGFRG